MKTNQPQKNTSNEWQQVKLGDVAFLNKKNISEQGGVKDFYYIDLSSVNAGILQNNKNKINIKNAPSRAKRIFEKNDVLFANVRPNLLGHLYVNFDTKDFVCSTGFTVISPQKEALSGYFIYNYFFTKKFTDYIENITVGSSYPAVNSSDLEKLKLHLPSLPEQSRIVAVLETWDKSIEKLLKKIEIKKNIKKFLMNELLTGKKRLKGFSDKWETVGLGELGEYYSGITGKNKEDFGFGKPFISYMNIYSNSRIDTNIKDLVNIKPTDNQNQVKYGDLFLTTSSETPDEVGVASVLLDKNIGEVYLNSFCFGFRLHNFEKLTPEFAQYYFRTRHFRKSMFEIAQGASRFNLSKKYFVQIEIKIPKLIQEQNAIAEILVSADGEIKKLQDKLKIFKEQKRYLLNNLITGTIRTPENLLEKVK